jgi:hypothetical protein
VPVDRGPSHPGLPGDALGDAVQFRCGRQVQDRGGRYFVRDTEQRSPEISYDRDLQQRLRAASDSCTAMAPDHNS